MLIFLHTIVDIAFDTPNAPVERESSKPEAGPEGDAQTWDSGLYFFIMWST